MLLCWPHPSALVATISIMVALRVAMALSELLLEPNFVFRANCAMQYSVILAESQLIGGHTEYVPFVNGR